MGWGLKSDNDEVIIGDETYENDDLLIQDATIDDVKSSGLLFTSETAQFNGVESDSDFV